MTERTCYVPDCDRPIPTGDQSTACPRCWSRLERDLAQMPALIDELNTTITRQDRIAGQGGKPRTPEPDEPDPQPVVAWLRGEHTPGAHEAPAVFHIGASDALDQVGRVLWQWIRVATSQHPAFQEHTVEGPALPGQRWPIDYRKPTPTTNRGMAVTLLALHPWIRQHPDGWVTITTIRKAVTDARHAIDRAPDLEYAGVCSASTSGCPGPAECPCGCHDGHDRPCTMDGGCGLTKGAACPGELYIPKRTAAGVARCSTCGTDHDIPARRRYLLEAARDVLVTTTEACAAVSTHGAGALSEATIRSWKQRGRLIAHGHDSDGRDLWRLGDVIDLALARDTAKGA